MSTTTWVTSTGRPRGLVRTLTTPTAARLTSYVAVIVGWFLVSAVRDRVPDPIAVVRFLWIELSGGAHGGVLRGESIQHLLPTLQRFGTGLLIALVVGVALGGIIGSFRYFHALLNDTLLVFLALPAVIWAFITVVWFGLGERAPIWTVALTAFPFVAVNVTHGVQAIGDDLRQMSQAFKVPVWKRIRYLILPSLKWPLLFVTTYQTLSLLTSFEYILVLTDGNFGTRVWSLWAYQTALSNYFGNFQYGLGAAMAVILVVIGVAASIVYMKFFRFDELVQEPKIEAL